MKLWKRLRAFNDNTRTSGRFMSDLGNLNDIKNCIESFHLDNFLIQLTF